MKKIVHDTTDSFDQRLDVLQAAHAPQVEIDAAIVVYERLRTAQAICHALVPGERHEALAAGPANEREAGLARQVDAPGGKP